ncbi:MAG: hypothetical protein INF91_10705 [Alphaproteobacteria bacterium]|nr:hypothetical protein [Alphaproteobacteria bacterium]
MGKVLKPLVTVAAFAAVAIPGVGPAIGLALTSSLGLGVGAIGVLSTVSTIALTAGAAALNRPRGAGGQSGLSAFDPKAISIDAAEPRKMLFGRALFPMSLRHPEPYGTGQDRIDYVFALAAHKSGGPDQIFIENDLAWTAEGGAQGAYAGYLTVEVVTEGGAAAYHTTGGGGWGAAHRMTGCTTMKVSIRRSDISKTNRSPFAGGISGRWSAVGNGMPVYDPALDSTVPGGSGSQRADDCSTWAYSVGGVDRGNNPALQLLAYLLGWRINGEVSVGLGMDPATLDLPSFATAAALCDESVALTGGGTQRRFEAGRAFSDDDDPTGVMAELCKAMNAELVDDGGRLGLRVAVNDLSGPLVKFTDADLIGGYSWKPALDADQQFTVVRGRYSQPGTPSLYSLVDFDEVPIPRSSVAPRPLRLELTAVQDPRRARRIAKQAGQRSLYQGTFTCTVGVRGWLLKRNQVVEWDLTPRGWVGEILRVRALQYNWADGTVTVTFREENAAIYQWDASEAGEITPVTPTPYDRRNNPWNTLIDEAGTTANWPNVVDSEPEDHPRPDDGAVNTRRPDALIGDRRVDRVLADAKAAAEAVIADAIERLNRYRRHEKLLYLDGLSLGTVVVNEKTERIEGQTAIVDTLSLIGAKSADNAAFILDTDRVKVSPTQSLAAKFAEISATGFEGALASAVATLNEAIAVEAEARASAITSLTSSFGSALDTKASATALSSLTTIVEEIDGVVSSQALALASVTSTAGTASATASLALQTANGDQASIILKANAAGRAAVMRFEGEDSKIAFEADEFEVWNGEVRALYATGGDVYFGGKVYWSETIGRPTFGLASDSKAIDEITNPRAIDNLASVDVSAKWFATEASASTDITVQIQSRPVGGSWTDVGASATGSTGPGEPGVAQAVRTFTNTTGESQRFEFRAVLTKSNAGAAVTTDAAKSFLRI